MQVNTLEQQKGFTLVEIAIVLVIIGLLLGGVLKGQELITNSKIKSVTQDFDGIQAAYYAYQDRLGSVPGDGDGDGKIDSGATGEQLFWDQLRTQGFVKGASASTHPTHGLCFKVLKATDRRAEVFEVKPIEDSMIEVNKEQSQDIIENHPNSL